MITSASLYATVTDPRRKQKRDDPPPIAHDPTPPRLSAEHGGAWDGTAIDESGKRLVTDKRAYCRLRKLRPVDITVHVSCVGDERDGVPQCPDLLACSLIPPQDQGERYAQDQASAAERHNGAQGWRAMPGLGFIERQSAPRRRRA